MQSQNRLLDDLARVASGALGIATGVREEVEGRLRQQFERILQQMDLITREEFEAVQAMAARARDEQEALGERLVALEARVQALEKKRARATSGGRGSRARSTSRSRSRGASAGRRRGGRGDAGGSGPEGGGST